MMISVLGERGKTMDRKIEFIEEYIKVGNNDYQWNDNHGELVRCKDCKHKGGFGCPWWKGEIIPPEWYCANGEREDDE